MYDHLYDPKRFLRVTTLLTTALLLSLGAWAADDTPQTDVIGPFVSYAIHHDVSPPLREMGRMGSPYPPGFVTEIPLGVSPRQFPENQTTSPDLLRQSENRPIEEAGMTPMPLMNFEGITNIFGGLPPDTQGDVGVDYYVQWINLHYAVFDKTTGAIVPGGGPFLGNSLFAGFGGACNGGVGESPECACQINNNGDPIVLFDHLAERWLMTQFSINEGIECVALSQTRDPLGSYDRWAFLISPGQRNDYPKLGLMPDAYYISTRDFPSGTGNFAGFGAFDRAAMLAGAASPAQVKFGVSCDSGNNNCPDGVQPPHLEGPAPPTPPPGIFTKVWDDDFEGPWVGAGGSDGIRLWELDYDPVTPASSTFTELPFLPSAAFNANMCGGARCCIPQPGSSCSPFGGGTSLDAISTLQMYRAQFRHHESTAAPERAPAYNTLLVLNTVDATGSDVAGIRWAELRDDGAGGSWSVFQEGTYAPADGENRWMGSIAMDGSGNIALGYSVSSGSTFPSIRYVTREAGDPLGTMPGGEVELIAGSGSQTSSSSRWGDYSSMSVDPVDDCTFWYTQEYMPTGGSASWSTRIGAFKIEGCGGPRLLVDPGEHVFGAVEVGQTGTPITVNLLNESTTDTLNVTGMSLSNMTDFSVNTSPAVDPCGGTAFALAAGADCNVEIQFAPQSQAVFNATFEVTSDDPDSPDQVAVEGTGYNDCPFNDTESVTNGAPQNGSESVSACLEIEVGPYELGATGDLTLTTGETVEFLNGSVFEGEVTVIWDFFLSLP